MIIGICVIDLKLYEGFSLKDKRSIVKSVVNKVRNKFNISIAEVDNHDKWQLATLGFTTIGTDKVQANKVLNNALNFIEANTSFEISNIEMEFI